MANQETSSKFSKSQPPYLAIITETDACETVERMEATYVAIQEAVSTGKVDLVSIRLSKSDSSTVFDRAVELTKRIVDLSENGTAFQVVCSSDWVEVAIQAHAHGIHVKEMHLPRVPSIVDQFDYPILIGTSTHSVESALASFKTYQPDYYFVGTCYLTKSHPEKTSPEDLEGPTLPGQVRRALQQQQEEFSSTACPKILAIGGIDETNCREPVSLGADGVAVIRAVVAAEDPADAVTRLYTSMASTM